MKIINLEETKSVLKLNNIYISNFDFSRSEEFDVNFDPVFGFKKHIEKKSQTEYNVSLSVNVEDNSKSLKLHLTIVGCFEIEDVEANDVLIYKNSLAILFPYLRSELTLLTSQPSMYPIILPPININLFFEATENN